MVPGPASKRFQTLMAEAMASFSSLLAEVRACTVCEDHSALGLGRSADDHYMALRLEPGAK